MAKPQDAETLTLIYIIKSIKRNVNRQMRFFTKTTFEATSKLDILTSETIWFSKELKAVFSPEGRQSDRGCCPKEAVRGVKSVV